MAAVDSTGAAFNTAHGFVRPPQPSRLILSTSPPECLPETKGAQDGISPWPDLQS
jgi:hypothetical protein